MAVSSKKKANFLTSVKFLPNNWTRRPKEKCLNPNSCKWWCLSFGKVSNGRLFQDGSFRSSNLFWPASTISQPHCNMNLKIPRNCTSFQLSSYKVQSSWPFPYTWVTAKQSMRSFFIRKNRISILSGQKRCSSISWKSLGRYVGMSYTMDQLITPRFTTWTGVQLTFKVN